jgi:hypothetical protein
VKQTADGCLEWRHPLAYSCPSPSPRQHGSALAAIDCTRARRNREPRRFGRFERTQQRHVPQANVDVAGRKTAMCRHAQPNWTSHTRRRSTYDARGVSKQSKVNAREPPLGTGWKEIRAMSLAAQLARRMLGRASANGVRSRSLNGAWSVRRFGSVPAISIAAQRVCARLLRPIVTLRRTPWPLSGESPEVSSSFHSR